MIQIDMEMPDACSECPFKNQYGGCPIVPGVPAWQKEIDKCKGKRSEHCPLKEVNKDS